MENTPDNLPGVREFGELFKELRTREKFSQRKSARILGVDESTVARIEAGTRKPPRAISFYERLRDLPGVTEADIGALLGTSNAPPWLAASGVESKPRPFFVVAKLPELPGLSTVISFENSGLGITPDDLKDLGEVAKRAVTIAFRTYLELKQNSNPRKNP